VVKDESETWETITPSLRGADAGYDMKAVRNMIDAGSGFPPHWRGEGGDVNVATAEAMQSPPEKMLMKRQQYFVWLLQDILYQAFLRAVEIGAEAAIAETDYAQIFTVDSPDVSLCDNAQLASGAETLAQGFAILQNTLLGKSPTLHRLAADLVLKFAGEPQEEDVLDKIVNEAKAEPILPVFMPGKEVPGNQPGNQSGNQPSKS
jgi:hypothetical protein